MKKTYINPKMILLNIEDEEMVCTSPGVADGKSLGDAYNEEDVSYAKGSRNLWNEEW